MKKADCFTLGYIAKLHGKKGEVSLFLSLQFPQEAKDIKTIWIDMDGLLIPFFISNWKWKNEKFALITLEDITSTEEAKNILKREVFLQKEKFPELATLQKTPSEIIGFEAVDTNYGTIGKVDAIQDNPLNPLLQIYNEEQKTEVLIPLGNDPIIEVDIKNKKILLETSPGIIELYLEEK